MKLIISSVVLLLATSAAIAKFIPGADHAVFDYHRRFGIPEATRIRTLEEQLAKSSLTRVVGGSVVDISEVPYQVGLIITIEDVYTSICGGALISNNRVLTAAHCNSDGFNTASYFTAVLGSNLLFSGGVRIDSNDIVENPGYTPGSINNNIAVLRIQPVTLSNVIQTISLPNQDELSTDFAYEQAIISGYGATESGAPITYSQILNRAEVSILPNTECTAVFGDAIQPSHLCTDGSGNKGTCSGDAGSPLTVISNGRRIVVGLSLFEAASSCEAGLPSGFTRISSFLSWILVV